MRAGGVHVNIKTKSGDAYDVTGPVVTLVELENVFKRPLSNYGNINFSLPGYTDQENFDFLFTTDVLQDSQKGIPVLTNAMRDAGIAGIGTPAGIKGIANQSASTAGLSIGAFIDNDYHWLVEAYVLAAPLSTGVTISGSTIRGKVPRDELPGERPIAIDGQEIISTKILPPLVMFGRYFGDARNAFRPYVGAMAMYAIFFDAKATEALNDYVGGSNPGDTTVSIKNAFGVGPVLGFQVNLSDSWHASLNIGHVRLKTQATLTTRNTMIRSDSKIAQDLGVVSDQILAGETVYGSLTTCRGGYEDACKIVVQNGGLTSLIMKGIAADRGSANLGTFVRKTDTTLTNTIFMFSVGRSF